MRLFFILPLLFSMSAAAADLKPRENVDLCGFSADRFLASKVLFTYPALLSTEFVTGAAKPEFCALAVKQLEATEQRTPDENTLLGVAAAGWLATTLRNAADRNGDLEIDADFNACDTAVVPDKAILWILAAQKAFLMHAGRIGRSDVQETARLVMAECSKSTAAACESPGDATPAEVAAARGLLQKLLERKESCISAAP